MRKIYNFIVNLIGELYRDIVVMFGEDYVQYTIKDGYFVYKSIIPVNITIGRYKFLKEKDFNTLFS